MFNQYYNTRHEKITPYYLYFTFYLTIEIIPCDLQLRNTFWKKESADSYRYRDELLICHL